MGDEWINAEELMAATGWKPRTLQRRMQDGEITWRETQVTLANGRKTKEFLLRKLPNSIQSEILKRRTAIVPFDSVEARESDSLIIPFAAKNAGSESSRTVLADAEAERQANERYEMIRPLLEFLAIKDKGERQRWCWRNNRIVGNSDDLAKLIAKEFGCSHALIWFWKKRYDTAGLAGLADKIRSDKGQSRWFEKHPDARTFAAYLYLVERMSVSSVCKQLECEAEQLGLAGDLPSRETVRLFLSQQISPAMKTYAREGERAYRERMAPYVKRGYTEYANQIWVGDHMIHDIEISNDIFDDVPFGTPGRLRLSAFIDYRSRKAWGTWAWEGSSRSIAATMVRAMLEVGPPEHIYVDNGKDYRKVAKGAQRSSETFLDESALAPADWWRNEYDALEKTGVLAKLGIKVTHCIPRHPQSKHVERFFRTLHMHFDAAHNTYTSGSPATRPTSTEAAMMKHRWLLKRGRAGESAHPLASQVILGCLAWLDHYNNSPHSGEGMDGRTPNEVFEQERNPNQQPIPEPQVLAMAMLDYTRRRVRECAVTLNKRRYTPAPEDRDAWAAMHEANETEVLVAYNASDPEYAVVLDLDGRKVLGWLQAEQLLRFAPWDEQTQEQIGESMEIRRGLEKATKQSLAVITGAARKLGARSAQETLYGRLQLPAAVDQLVTQSKPRLRPDTKAQAPKSAAEIAEDLLKELAG